MNDISNSNALNENGFHWNAFLKTVLASEQAHFFWLRTLSYLEYIGYRKMVKALEHSQVDQSVFEHLSDEIQHSFLLKDLASRMFPALQQDYPDNIESLIENAESYFQNLDQCVFDWVEAPSLHLKHYYCYLLVSYIIERRAMVLYPQYRDECLQSEVQSVLQKIIGEEREHLADLQKKIFQIPQLAAVKESGLFEVEEKLFQNFLIGISPVLIQNSIHKN